MASESQARKWAHDGFVEAIGREPSLLEVQFLQAIARLETGYGQGWKGEGVGSWNMGAVQAGKPPCNPATSFLYTDSHPNADGTSTKYSICFRRYPDAIAGMADVARILYKQMAIKPTSITAVSTQMYEKHYYEGFGPTREARIANHVKALTANLVPITTALNEPMPPTTDEGGTDGDTPKVPPVLSGESPVPVYYLVLSPTLSNGAVLSIHEGMKDSPLVQMVQASLKDKGLYKGRLDGDHGPLTEAAIRKLLA